MGHSLCWYLNFYLEKKKKKHNFLPQAWSADYDYIMNKTQIHYCKMFPVYSLCEQPAKITAFIRPTCLSDSLTASTITIQEDGTMTWYWKCFRFRVIENQDAPHVNCCIQGFIQYIFYSTKISVFVEIGNKCHWSWDVIVVLLCVFLKFGFWLLTSLDFWVSFLILSACEFTFWFSYTHSYEE